MARLAIALTVAAVACVGGWATASLAQSNEIFLQEREGGPIRPLTSVEKERLQDPLFKLVLARQPAEIRLAKIQELIQPLATPTQTRRFFVISEEIADPRKPPAIPAPFRRAVIDFRGDNGGVKLDGNVMLSIFFTSDQVEDVLELEAWGWDETNGVYNYYKLDRSRTEPKLTWKLRATSLDADLKSVAERRGTCLRCHATGVPVMKELLFPWNNWNSNQSPADYLQPLSPEGQRWPVANDPQLKFLDQAQNLEPAIKNSITHFNQRRFAELVRQDSQGQLIIAQGRRVLRPLFETTEINLITANQRSGLHPLEQGPHTGPTQPIQIPNSSFLSAGLLGGGGGLNGLGFDVQFRTVARIPPASYKTIIDTSGVKIRPNQGGPIPGDTQFAWLTPEMGFVASHWIDMLVGQRVLSPGFVAAALAAELETPIFSAGRARLLAFVPENFTVTPGEPHPDRLTRQVISALEAVNPTAGSSEAEFLAALKSPDPVAVVRERIADYKKRIADRFSNDSTRDAEIQRLFQLLIARRQAMVNHPIFGNLVESGALLPLP
jgi:hypothetical protein